MTPVIVAEIAAQIATLEREEKDLVLRLEVLRGRVLGLRQALTVVEQAADQRETNSPT